MACGISKQQNVRRRTPFLPQASNGAELQTARASCPASSLDSLVGAIGNTSCVGGGISRRSVLLVAELRILLIVVVDVEAELRRVDVAVTPDEEGTEDRLGQQVQNTVEDGLGVGRDDIATLADTPGDRVQGPEEGSQATADEEGATDILAHDIGVLTGLESEHIDDETEGGAAEDEVSPLVARADESASQTGDDHDLVDKNDIHDSRPRHAGSEEQVHEQERGSDEPVDVAHIEDLTVETSNARVAALELDSNAGPAKVRCHGEVCNGGDHGDRGGDVVEDAVLARLGGGKTDEGHGRDHHDGRDSPVPIGAMGGDGDAGVRVVDGIV